MKREMPGVGREHFAFPGVAFVVETQAKGQNVQEQEDEGSEASNPEAVAGRVGPRFTTYGMLLAITGTFLFALKSIFIKLAFGEGSSPTVLLTIRMLFALPFYLIVIWTLSRAEDSKPMPRSVIWKAVALGFPGYYLASFLDLSGLAYISAQLERLTLFTYPALVAVLAWMFLDERLTPRTILAIVFSYTGVFVMYFQERQISEGENATWGVLLVACSALSYSLYILFAKPAMQRIGSRKFTSLAMIGSTVFVAIHAGVTVPIRELLDVPPIVLLYGVVLAFVCTVLPSFMINESILRIGATKTAVIGTVGPVLTMLLAIVILKEQSSPQHFLGMAIAIGGVSLVVVKPSEDVESRRLEPVAHAQRVTAGDEL